MKDSVEQIQAKYTFTECRACRLLLVSISSFRYKPRQNNDDLKARLVALACQKPRYGYRRLHVLLERDGEHVKPQAGISDLLRGGPGAASKEA